MFSSVWAGVKSDHRTGGMTNGGSSLLVSSMTAPCSSRRMKLVLWSERTYITVGRRCVWTGAVSPALISVRRTRTRSFSKRTMWFSPAATGPSSSSDQGPGSGGVVRIQGSLSAVSPPTVWSLWADRTPPILRTPQHSTSRLT